MHATEIRHISRVPPLNGFSAARLMEYMHCREYRQTAGISGLPVSALDQPFRSGLCLLVCLSSELKRLLMRFLFALLPSWISLIKFSTKMSIRAAFLICIFSSRRANVVHSVPKLFQFWDKKKQQRQSEHLQVEKWEQDINLII